MNSGIYSYCWDDAATARYYENFCTQHHRYADANDALLRHAAIAPGQRVLDLASGTGRTAEAALAFIGDGRIDCVEPANAMRRCGEKRVRDARIVWHSAIPDRDRAYDRILCGAAIWQLLPLSDTFRNLRRLLTPDGALVFNIPAMYLGEPDPPGGGADPTLTSLISVLSEKFPPGAHCQAPQTQEHSATPTPETIGQLLNEAGFRAERWAAKQKLDQIALRDWMKIPVLTNGLMPHLDADARASEIDHAFSLVDPTSWRYERWFGWTVWS